MGKWDTNGHGGWKHRLAFASVVTLSMLVARALRRPPTHRLPKVKAMAAGYYRAEGGPYNGELLLLSDGTTAPMLLRLGLTTWRGRYRCGIVGSTQKSNPGTCKWVPHEDYTTAEKAKEVLAYAQRQAQLDISEPA